jgi:hypothetical protein
MTETVLPAVAGITRCEKPRDVLTRAGVVFHGPIEQDGVLCRVTLPNGWSKVEIGPNRFRLLDECGRERAESNEGSNPFITMSPRFRISRNLESNGEILAMVIDANGVVRHATQAFKIEPEMDYERKLRLKDQVKEEAEEWLSKHYPHWRDPGAHWD